MILACFGVLHYKAYKETIKCVNSLLKLNGIQKSVIIIYDNGSNDGSYEILKEKYQCYRNVRVIQDTEPNGFSRGNNNLYRLAKKFNPKFFIAMNNDIIIKQKDFMNVLLKIANSNDYYIIGPDIYAPTVAEHQSPIYKAFPDRMVVEKDMKEKRNRLVNIDEGIAWESTRINKNRLKRYLPAFIIDIIRKLKGNEKGHDWNKPIENPVFSGSFLIFTDRFINANSKLMWPETKFYFEELLLANRCRKNGYKTLYTPELKVWHMHGVATVKSHSDMEEYVRFKYGNMIESYGVFKKELEQ